MADTTTKLSPITKVYRHKETLPLSLSTREIYDTLRVVDYASHNKIIDKATADTMPDRILVEGRADAGVNGFDTNNPKTVALFESMLAQGFDHWQARTIAAIKDKEVAAKRLGISFDEAWNGTGKSSAGKTGKDYAARMKQMSGAAQAENNAPLRSLIGLAARDTPLSIQEQLSLDPADILGKQLKVLYGTMSGPGDKSPLDVKMYSDAPFSPRIPPDTRVGMHRYNLDQILVKAAEKLDVKYAPKYIARDREDPKLNQVLDAIATELADSLKTK